MSYSNYKLKVLSNKEVAPNILLLSTQPDQKIDFLGGQYFSFKVGEKINRSYSTLSAPGEKNLEFVVDITPQGPGSIFVQNLKEGDEIDAMGPFGFFTLENTKAYEDESPLICVATGTGIAPMRSMILDLLKNKRSQRSVILYFGLRYNTEAYLHEEFTALEKEFSNFKFIPVISKPSEHWQGERGHCQDVIMKQPIVENAKVYVCGRTENVKSIAEALIQYGYPKERVFFEKFG